MLTTPPNPDEVDRLLGAVREPKEHVETTAEEVAELLLDANNVMIVPSYGIIAAQGAAGVASITSALQAKGVTVSFSIHPFAGQYPGQIEAALTSAGCPKDRIFQMDEVQAIMPTMDVCLVMGANDIVNPAAITDPRCEIYMMKVIKAWEAGKCVFMKRSIGGYAELVNLLFYHQNTKMLLGEARRNAEELARLIREGGGLRVVTLRPLGDPAADGARRIACSSLGGNDLGTFAVPLGESPGWLRRALAERLATSEAQLRLVSADGQVVADDDELPS